MKKQVIFAGLFTASSLGLFSCNSNENDTPSQANVAVKVRTIAQDSQEEETENARLISGANIITANAAISNLTIHGSSESAGNIEVPIEPGTAFNLSLIQSALPLSETLGTLTLNQGNYSKISLQFQQDDSLTEGDAMYGKTLEIKGNVNEQLLTIFTNTEELLSAASKGGSLHIEGNQEVYLNFDINQLLENVDLTLAVDGNQNGTIEIEPNNIDGNRNLYLTIIGNLENALYISNE